MRKRITSCADAVDSLITRQFEAEDHYNTLGASGKSRATIQSLLV
jgi:hypothetical protein